jgi:hypothetical protein
MSRITSTALAAICTLGVVGFSGHLTSARAEPVDLPAAKVYAAKPDPALNGLLPTPAPAVQAIPNRWNIPPETISSTACGLGCRTGFFGYR